MLIVDELLASPRPSFVRFSSTFQGPPRSYYASHWRIGTIEAPSPVSLLFKFPAEPSPIMFGDEGKNLSKETRLLPATTTSIIADCKAKDFTVTTVIHAALIVALQEMRCYSSMSCGTFNDRPYGDPHYDNPLVAVALCSQPPSFTRTLYRLSWSVSSKVSQSIPRVRCSQQMRERQAIVLKRYSLFDFFRNMANMMRKKRIHPCKSRFQGHFLETMNVE